MSLVSRIRRITFCPVFLVFLLVVFGPGAGSAHAQTQPQNAFAEKNVLILHAHEASAPVFMGTDKGLLKTLESGGVPAVNQSYRSLDLRQHPGPEYRRLLVEEMRVRYGHRKLDMIITMYPEALEFVLQDCRDVFPDVPVLGMYLPQGLELPKTSRRIIGHSASLDILGTLEIALKLVPGAERVYVVSGAHELDRRVEDQAREDFKKWEGRLEFRYLSRMPFEEILAAVSTAPPDTIVLLLVFSKDIAGRSYTSPNLTQEVSRVSAAPIFGLLDVALGKGIVGGSLINFEHIGARAGELVLDILKGLPGTGNMPEFLQVPPVAMFDWRQLRRWKLSESALPKASIVINKAATPWDFRYYIIGGLIFVTAQTVLLAGLLVQRRRKISAEESLRQKTDELDQFFNLSPDLLRIANMDGYPLRLNRAWERILGYSREELMAKQFFDFVHPDDLEKTRKAVFTLASQQTEIHFENRYRCKDGTYRWLEWTAAPAGNLIYAAARDITERLREDMEARQRREELAHVTRIATMGELTTSLAHEINQPLTAILSNAEAAQRFLSQGAPDIAEVRQILEDIVQDDRRASEVVRKIRALVKKGKPTQEVLDLNKTTQEVISLVRGESLLQGLSITMDLSPELSRVSGDRVQLQQVILNLILNSAAAMRTSSPSHRKIIVRTAMENSGTVKVSVKDFGTGIDENNIERLFDPFYTTKPDGLGMGLPISQRIIKAHGGTMEASNNPEGGATFSFTLPAHERGTP